MKFFSKSGFSVSQKNIVLGSRIILAGEAVRLIERWLYTFNVRKDFPEIVSSNISLFKPIELWQTPLPELYLLVGFVFIGVSFKNWKWKSVGFFLLFILNCFGTNGGTTYGKSLILLQPALLACSYLSFQTNGFLPISLLSLMYGFNGLAKINSDWLSGVAVGKFLTSTLWSLGLEKAPIGFEWKLLTWFTLLWEISGFVLLIPFKYKIHAKMRLVYGLIAILFHTTLMLIGSFYSIGIIAIGLWVMVYPAPEEKSRSSCFVPAIVCMWIIVCNLNLGLLQTLRTPLERMSLYPEWKLFSRAQGSGNLFLRVLTPEGQTKEYHSLNYTFGFFMEGLNKSAIRKQLPKHFCTSHKGKFELVLYKDDQISNSYMYDCERVSKN